jgi:hypothetical protein
MYESRLIVQLLRARDDWERLINHVGLSRVGIGRVSGHWSVKDIVAHVMSREQHLADRLAAISRGEHPRPCSTHEALDAFAAEFGYPDFDSPVLSGDAADEWVFQKYRYAPMNEIVAHELHAFDCLLVAVRSIPESRLMELGILPRILQVTVEHYRQHGAEIRRCFKRPVRQV